MKKAVIIFFLLLLVSLHSFSQTAVTSSNRKAAYLKRSKTEKIIAWSLLGAGSAAIIAGAAISDNAVKKPDATGLAVGGIGLATSIVSIPFFIASSHSAKKAAKIQMGNSRVVIPTQNRFAAGNQLAIILKINLDRTK
jgi:hypothetical protein